MIYELRKARTEADRSARRDQLTTDPAAITNALISAPYTVQASFDDRAAALEALAASGALSVSSMRSWGCWVLDVGGLYVAAVDDAGEDTGEYDPAPLPDLPASWLGA